MSLNSALSIHINPARCCFPINTGTMIILYHSNFTVFNVKLLTFNRTSDVLSPLLYCSNTSVVALSNFVIVTMATADYSPEVF